MTRTSTLTRVLVLAGLVAALAAGPATAHEADDRAIGTVEQVTAERIVIRAVDGHEVPFVLTRGTRFSIGDEPARREDVRIGQRAVVHGKRVGDSVEAVRVRLGAPAAKEGAKGPRLP